jgi:hypothetical protein
MARTGLISVVTAVLPGDGRHLLDSYGSLRRQRLPNGWSWEWCLQSEDYACAERKELLSDPQISLHEGPFDNLGAALSAALTQANGQLVRTLNPGEVFLPGALAREIETLHRVAWCTSAALCVREDGTTTTPNCGLSAGLLAPPSLREELERNKASILAQPLAAHAGLIWALGGWPLFPGSETIGLMLAAEAVTPGEFISQPSVICRSADEQGATEDQEENENHLIGIEFALERAKSLREMGWKWRLQSINELLSDESEDLDAIPMNERQAAMLARLASQRGLEAE